MFNWMGDTASNPPNESQLGIKKRGKQRTFWRALANFRERLVIGRAESVLRCFVLVLAQAQQFLQRVATHRDTNGTISVSTASKSTSPHPTCAPDKNLSQRHPSPRHARARTAERANAPQKQRRCRPDQTVNSTQCATGARSQSPQQQARVEGKTTRRGAIQNSQSRATFMM